MRNCAEMIEVGPQTHMNNWRGCRASQTGISSPMGSDRKLMVNGQKVSIRYFKAQFLTIVILECPQVYSTGASKSDMRRSPAHSRWELCAGDGRSSTFVSQ